MITVIESTNINDDDMNISIFLAGGITNCPDWQQELIEKIKDRYSHLNLTLYNPRRKSFPINDPNASTEQITWEFDHLKKADIIIFWFSSGSLNPIVLYELGMWGNSGDRNIIIGVDPNYERTQDVMIQTKLARPDLSIVRSLDALADTIQWVL